jgi:hypothetical protein
VTIPVSAIAARADTLTQPSGLTRTLMALPVAPSGSTVRLDALLTRPAAPGRYAPDCRLDAINGQLAPH